jgi:hypothetical protein
MGWRSHGGALTESHIIIIGRDRGSLEAFASEIPEFAVLAGLVRR